ncbi:hypothetical protein HBI56_043650 [Parastagonospora nodorum]|nr:hypothetical protein HBH53_009440 [Parastagonospora nodorum]KAH3986459.1 hypothetical protein HBH52_040630 [Parastagonospora nodorum]KAH3988525.1 hypothetical protein HBH51_008400 [Parastagonospora nodorum]KAH4004933.1 hypothetical protein HBI10_046930 [Parastagonospora nodorum]KAH4031222.1 hypothetical protein HBI13_030390 [Parastagonospora nodorum]
MSFGFSPSDAVKLVEISTRVYIAFKDANENSEAQVESLVREFQAFAICLLELDELMKEFGKPLPFPVDEFKKTLEKCEASLRPYKDNLVDKKMSASKFVWTIKYIGKEKELDGLRKQISGHYQALNMCLSFLQLRLSLESSRREQRLLLEPRHRAASLGGQWYTSSAVGAASQSSQSSPLALPAPDDAHPLYKDWEIFNKWLKTEDERMGQDLQLVRPSSWGDTPATTGGVDSGTSAVLHRLRCEVEDAIMFEENRAKRAAVEKRSHLAPSDAMKQQVREMPPAPRPRTYTIDTEASSSYDALHGGVDMGGSLATLRPNPGTASPALGSPQTEQEYFISNQWAQSPIASSISENLNRSSVSTMQSIFPNGHLSPSLGLDVDATSTIATSPEDALSFTLRHVLSTASLVPLNIGDAALQWTDLGGKAKVERKSSERVSGQEKTVFETQECYLHWKYREDGGMSLRATYRSKDKKAKLWSIQDFPALGPSIPLTTTIDGDISVDFPRGSFGRLNKQWLDIRYTFSNSESSSVFQTLLYTNNGKDAAELMFDRPIRTISSDKHKPECRGRNLRLWRRTELHLESNGLMNADVLIFLFYTSCLEGKGHWVEEPHYAFEWLTESVYKKDSDKLTLSYSKDPSRWTPDKLFQRRRSSQASSSSNGQTSPTSRARHDSMESPGIIRSGTGGSAASSTASIRTSRSFFGRSKASTRIGNINSFGYSKLDIEFQSSKDRRAFLDVWKQHVKPLGSL